MILSTEVDMGAPNRGNRITVDVSSVTARMLAFEMWAVQLASNIGVEGSCKEYHTPHPPGVVLFTLKN